MEKGTKFTAREIFLLLCAIGVGCLMGSAIVVMHESRIAPKLPSFTMRLASLADENATETEISVATKLIKGNMKFTGIELSMNSDNNTVAHFIILVPKSGNFTEGSKVNIAPLPIKCYQNLESQGFVLISITIEKP